MTTQMGQVWEEGLDAYLDGKKEEDNPYNKEGSDREKHRHDEWLRGYHIGRDRDAK